LTRELEGSSSDAGIQEAASRWNCPAAQRQRVSRLRGPATPLERGGRQRLGGVVGAAMAEGVQVERSCNTRGIGRGSVQVELSCSAAVDGVQVERPCNTHEAGWLSVESRSDAGGEAVLGRLC
jgi:hypothetical protein